MTVRYALLASIATLMFSFAAALPARANDGVRMTSLVLSAFFGRPIEMRAEVALPEPDLERTPALETRRTMPAIYVVHAFRGAYRPTFAEDATWRAALRAAGCTCAVVFLDASQPYGHNEFVDSANDGPWETALETEFVPYLEARFHLDGTSAGRFLVGHSSGGWSALWLQIARPDFFGGAWAIAPDPVDFHDFTGIDLDANPPQNFYRDAAGERGFVRVDGVDTSTLRAYVAGEIERGHGGQFDSFEAVFSPRGSDGAPKRLFDRESGAIDPEVAAWWTERFDLVRRLRARWPHASAALRGKINIFVGTADTFHLETSVERFAVADRALGDDARITFVPGADHFTIFAADGGLIARIAREIVAAGSTTGTPRSTGLYSQP